MMNKKQLMQFKSISEIDRFLEKKDSGTLDNIYENILDEIGDEDEKEVVKEFNQSIKSLFKLVSR